MFKQRLVSLIISFVFSLAFIGAISSAAGIEEEAQAIFFPLATQGRFWPDGCYAPGTRSYKDSLPAPVLPAPVVNQGTVFTVTTTADDINGNVSAVPDLIMNPGPDGLSLREAMTAVNNDPGLYTIAFAQEIMGGTISVGGSGRGPLPKLMAGSVLINGDINNEGQPDITLQSAESENLPYGIGLYIAASNQAINGLILEGFTDAVLINGLEPESLYENISISNIATKDVGTAVHLATEAEQVATWASHNHYRHISILGSQLEAMKNGISIDVFHSTGDWLEDINISNNSIAVSPGSIKPGDGISVSSGQFRGADNNRIGNILVSDNLIEGNWNNSIFISAGLHGGSDNIVRGVDIVRNRVKIMDAVPEAWTGSRGIYLITGDSPSLDNPLIYPDSNLITDVSIAENEIEGFWDTGIDLKGSCGGARFNQISDVDIIGNEISSTIRRESGFGAGRHGIKITSALGCAEDPLDRPRRATTDNEVSQVIIQSNRVEIGKEDYVSTNNVFGAGGIILKGAEVGPANQNQLNDVWILLNEIDALNPGIQILGGFYDATENVVSRVKIFCNTIPTRPIFPDWLPGLRGINLTGGYMNAARNRVEDIELFRNDVAGGENDVSVSENMTVTAIDNVVNYDILPGLP